jgi:hypothetical protein
MTRPPAALAILLVVLAGCGGGGDDGGNGRDAPTKERFVADANRICREGEAKIAEVAKAQQGRIGRATTPEAQEKAVADVLETTAEEYQPYMDRLRDLEAPEALAGGWRAFLDGVQEAFDLIPELADATRDGDREKLSELTTRFSQIAGDTRPFAQDNGLSDCLPENGAG